MMNFSSTGAGGTQGFADGTTSPMVSRRSLANLAVVARHAAGYGEAVQLVYGDEYWTFADHAAAVSALAAGLAARFGVVKGTRVAIAMRNYPEFSLTFWATQMLGAIAVPINAWWQEAEIVRVLDLTGPTVIVADHERLGRVGPWADRADVPIVTARTGARAGNVSLDELMGSYTDADSPDPEVASSDPATILFTSGTTGATKGIVHTHENHLTNLRRTLELAEPSSRSRVQLATMPLFHITQLSSLYINAAFGGTTVLMRKWEPVLAASLIDRHQVTHTAGVPLQIEQLLDLAEAGRSFPSLISIGVGATNVPPHLPIRVWEAFGGRVVPSTGYGMTETTSSVTGLSGTDFVTRSDSVGRPHPCNEIRIMANGSEVPTGKVGEITVRGPNVVSMYWDGQLGVPVRRTDDSISTGDLGRLDEEGYLYVVGRSKEVIIRSGENVHSAEVEAMIMMYPGVAAAAIVGMSHSRWGEEVTAIIQPRASVSLDLDDLTRHLAKRLAYFKVPTRIHVVDEDLPATATGKTLKRELRERFRDSPPDFRDPR